MTRAPTHAHTYRERETESERESGSIYSQGLNNQYCESEMPLRVSIKMPGKGHNAYWIHST